MCTECFETQDTPLGFVGHAETGNCFISERVLGCIVFEIWSILKRIYGQSERPDRQNKALSANRYNLTFNVLSLSSYTFKVKEPRNRPKRTHRVSGGIAQLFLNLGTRRGCVVSITPWPLLPPGKTQYPLYRRLGGPRSRSG
jgi:hypothetical protein